MPSFCHNVSYFRDLSEHYLMPGNADCVTPGALKTGRFQAKMLSVTKIDTCLDSPFGVASWVNNRSLFSISTERSTE
jgi:hypothetical protein